MGTLWEEGDGRESLSIVYLSYIFYFELCDCQTGREGGRAQPLKEWHSRWGQKLVRTNRSKMLEDLTPSGLWALLCTPVFLPGKSHRRKSLVGYSPCGRKESDTTERLHFHFFIHICELSFTWSVLVLLEEIFMSRTTTTTKKYRYIISKNCQRVLMFHLWLVKCMIKLFFLSSFLFFLASLITENYKLAVNILTFLNDSIYCIWFLCQAHRCIKSSGADFSHQNSSSPTLYILKYAQGRKYKV